MTEKQVRIAETLFWNASKVPFGKVAVELKIHAGKCTAVIYTTSENFREKENGYDDAEVRQTE